MLSVKDGGYVFNGSLCLFLPPHLGVMEWSLFCNVKLVSLIWALTRENLSLGFLQISEQSDQRLCFALIRKYHILTCFERNFKILASLCSQAGWFESHFVRNPKHRLSPTGAHFIVVFLSYSCQRPASLSYDGPNGSLFHFSGHSQFRIQNSEL